MRLCCVLKLMYDHDLKCGIGVISRTIYALVLATSRMPCPTTLLSRWRYRPFALIAFGLCGRSLWVLGAHRLVNDVAIASEVSSIHVDRFRSSWMVAVDLGDCYLVHNIAFLLEGWLFEPPVLMIRTLQRDQTHFCLRLVISKLRLR
jgi:hypothetical protein